jgi:hypothetical protein
MKNFLLGIVVGFFLVSCAGAGFAFKYYGIDLVSYKGKLLNTKAENDLDFEEICKPSASIKSKCVVMKTPDFFALKNDYTQCKSELQCWQSGRCHN